MAGPAVTGGRGAAQHGGAHRVGGKGRRQQELAYNGSGSFFSSTVFLGILSTYSNPCSQFPPCESGLNFFTWSRFKVKYYVKHQHRQTQHEAGKAVYTRPESGKLCSSQVTFSRHEHSLPSSQGKELLSFQKLSAGYRCVTPSEPRGSQSADV